MYFNISVACVILLTFDYYLLISGQYRSYFNNKEDQSETPQEGGTDIGSSKIQFASYYGDHMVLQQAPQRAIVWGYASATNVRIEMKFRDRGYMTLSTNGSFGNPIWRLTLDPVMENGPFNITVSALGKSITLKDVLFGDVWLCSGQSNMEFTVGLSFNGSEEIENAYRYPNIRLFTVKRVYSDKQHYDFKDGDILQNWSVAGKESVGGPSFQYFSAVCWLYGKYLHETRKYPIGLVASSYGGTVVEAWSSPDALKQCNVTRTHRDVKSRSDDKFSSHGNNLGPNNNSVLWNAMIHPLLNMTLFGVLWYQGEANTVAPETYACTFPAMIDDWRQKFFSGTFGETIYYFPFGFVQIGPNKANHLLDDGFPAIRWHQTADFGYVPNYRMKNVFMAVALDLPDFTSPNYPIHPRDKTDVAKRLLLGGLAVAYNEKVNYQGPFPKSFHVNLSSSMIEITFELFGMPEIEVRSLDGFEVCCSFAKPYKCTNGTSWWIPSAIVQNSYNSITLSISMCTTDGNRLTGVRYLWRETPCAFKMCAVYAETLPAVPFISYGPWD